jgi:cell division protein FtsI (penicillin-binding protein 3)
MKRNTAISRRRRLLLLSLMLGSFAVLAGRSAQLQLVDGEFLQTQGQARHLRVVQVPAHRGMIVDRNGEPLAISTPVQSVWVNPGEMSSSSGDLSRLAQLLQLDVDHLRRLIGQRQGREFVYLRRHIAPDLAEDDSRRPTLSDLSRRLLPLLSELVSEGRAVVVYEADEDLLQLYEVHP